MLFPNRVLRSEANYICTIILQRLRTESRFGGGGSQAVCHQPQEPVLVDWPTHDFRQLYQFCQQLSSTTSIHVEGYSTLMLGIGVGDAQSRSKNVQLMLESNMMEACSYLHDSTGLHFNTTLFPITMYMYVYASE